MKKKNTQTKYANIAYFVFYYAQDLHIYEQNYQYNFLLAIHPNYSNSIVPGGLELISYSTLLIPGTSFTILFMTFCSTSHGI